MGIFLEPMEGILRQGTNGGRELVAVEEFRMLRDSEDLPNGSLCE